MIQFSTKTGVKTVKDLLKMTNKTQKQVSDELKVSTMWMNKLSNRSIEELTVKQLYDIVNACDKSLVISIND